MGYAPPYLPAVRFDAHKGSCVMSVCTSGVVCLSGVESWGNCTPEPVMYPKCEYCATCAVEEVSNCNSCGAPLPWDGVNGL